MLRGEREGLVARHGDPEHLVPMLGQEPGDAAGEQFAVVADDDAREHVALPALSPRHVLPPWNRTRQMLKHRASTSAWALLRHVLS